MPPINIAMLKALLQNQMMKGGLQRPQITGLPKQLQQALANKMVNLRQQRPIQESFPGQNIFQPPRMTGFPRQPQLPPQEGFTRRPQLPQQEGVPIDWAGILERSKPVTMTGQPSKGGESLFHETSGEQVKNLVTPIVDKTGLNVSTTSELALGQGGKGALIEFDKDILLGDRGSLRGLQKPGSKFVGQEFELVGGSGNPRAIKSFTLKEGVRFSKDPRLNKRIRQRMLLDFNEIKQEDGSIKFIRKPSTLSKAAPSPQAERDLKKTYRRNKKILEHREGIGNHYDTRRP